MATYVFVRESGKHHMRINGQHHRFVNGDEITVTDWDGKVYGLEDNPYFKRVDIPADNPSDKKDVLKVVHKGAGKYDVINGETGKKLNNSLLSKEEANALVDGCEQ